MKFPSDAPVAPAKLALLQSRIQQLNIAMDQVEEQAVKGSGPGGQKVNKTSSGVLLRYLLPQGTSGKLVVVKWARERSRALNRFLALRELADEVEQIVSPSTSARVQERDSIRKQKDRRRRRQN